MSPAGKKTVLIIEDSRFQRKANEMTLTRAGYGVLCAADCEEGLRVATEQKPDVIVLDMMLPKMGGPELLQALKKNPQTAPIPVIVLSSLAQKNSAKLINDGAAAYLEKTAATFESTSTAVIQAIQSVLANAR